MCLDIAPFGATCGTGSCRNDTCVCSDPDWSRSVEFAFYKEFEGEEDVLWCNTNIKLLRNIYMILGVTTIFTVVVYYSLINSAKAWKRLWPLFVEGFLIMLSSFYRVKNPKAVFGEDEVFTSLVSLSMIFAHIVGQGYYVDLVFYITKKYPILETASKTRIRHLGRSYAFLMVDGLVVTILGFSLLPVSEQDIRRKIFLSFAFLEGLHFAITIFNAVYIVDFYISFIRRFISTEESLPAHDEDLIVALRRQLPKLEDAKVCLLACNIPCLIAVVPTFFWEYTLTLWKYYIPLFHFCWILSASYSISSNAKYLLNRNKKFARLVSYDDLVR